MGIMTTVRDLLYCKSTRGPRPVYAIPHYERAGNASHVTMRKLGLLPNEEVEINRRHYVKELNPKIGNKI